MGIRNLDHMFSPRRIVVVGASNTPTAVGYTVLHNLVGSGFDGVVYPVDATHESVQGIQAYEDLASLPRPPDLAVICTPASTVPEMVRQCGQAGAPAVIIISAGFREVGEGGRRLEEEIVAEQQKFDGMRILGPNCLGIIVPGIHLNASFATATPTEGHIAFVSQSGALCTSVLDWAIDEGVGFSCFVSAGNMLDVSVADLIDYFGAATETRSIILYIESITEAREFMSAARAFARSKPIVVYKSGRFFESARAAASHTGATAGVDEVYEAAFQRAGIVRVSAVDDMFDCAELLARQHSPKGNRLAIVTNAGGPGVMAADALIARDGKLAVFSEETLQELDEILPSHWSRANPVDVLGDATPERFSQALELVLKDKCVDAVLAILTPQAMTDPTETAKIVGETAGKARKPVLAAWMGGRGVRDGIRVLNRLGVAAYSTPEQAVRAFMYLVSYAHNLELLHETPRDIPVHFHIDRQRLRGLFDTVLFEGGELLSENTTKALFDAYDIPVTRPYLARNAEEAVQAVQRCGGYPVVVKVHSAQIVHRARIGGVVLNVVSDEAVRGAFEQVTSSAAEAHPDVQISGVTIQRMVSAANSYELIVSAKKDPVFGAVLMVGTGGLAAEVFRDRALSLPPINETLGRRMLQSLKSWPLLEGHCGTPESNTDRLIEILMRFSYLVADYPEIKEIEINPLLVTSEEVIAIGARAILDAEVAGYAVRPYSHLAIRPYPEEYVTLRQLKDETPVVLRPIKPEDEPMWHELLGSCSQESIRFRFNSLFRQTTHEMATRYCYIDYDREMGIVAAVTEDNRRALIGVGRLIADANHETAEYAVIVVDRWHGHGLGSLLTDYCLEVAKRWGVSRVVAETSSSNTRMLTVFRSRGFTTDRREDNVVFVSKSTS